MTLKDSGRVMVFDAKPPFAVLKSLDTGPITNHVNFAYNANGRFAYVTVGGLNEVKVFNTDDFAQVATIGVGKLPHGVWPSGDGTRVYVGLENADALTAIDTLTNRVIATSPDRAGTPGHRLCLERSAPGRRASEPPTDRLGWYGDAFRIGGAGQARRFGASTHERIPV